MKASELAHLLFFQSFSPELRKALIEAGEIRDYQPGDTLFEAGDNETDFYVLATGRIQIRKVSKGGQSRILRTVLPGQTFALVSLFDHQPMFVTCDVLGPAKVFVIPREKFFGLIQKYYELSLFVIQGFVQRIRKYGEAYTTMTVYTVDQRFIVHLLELADRVKSNEVVLADTITALAENIGTVREVLSREISKMIKAGWIEKSGQKITIRNRKALELRLNDAG